MPNARTPTARRLRDSAALQLLLLAVNYVSARQRLAVLGCFVFFACALLARLDRSPRSWLPLLAALPLALLLLPVMALGLKLGNRLHHALSRAGVLRLIAALLVVNGAALAVRAVELMRA